MYCNLFDSHSHSENSPDGHHSVTFMVEAAVNRGLLGFAITDHVEAEHFEEKYFERRIKQSAIDTAIAREAFGKRIVLTLGVEIAQVFSNLERVEKLLDTIKFDFVLGSLHALVDLNFDFHRTPDYSAIAPDELNRNVTAYYAELLRLVKWGNFDVLAHLSYPLRYPKLYNDLDIDLKRYREPIDEVLRAVAQAGKGIEINTSGLRNAMNDTLPPAWVVKRFRELGGEIVTVGSDAHCVEDVGAGIEAGMELMANAGFEYFAFYRGRKPVMLRII